MGRRKKLPLLEKLEIVDLAAEGKSIARWNEKIVFVKDAIPGDIVDVQLSRKRKKFMEGYPVKFHEYSDDRIEPICKHFGVCGGCKWQQLPYEKQLFYKQKQVKDNLERIGKIELPEILPILPSENQTFYRNKLEYTFSASRWMTDEEIAIEGEISNRNALGFHVPGRFDRVLNIEHCSLQSEISNQIRNSLREFVTENKYSFYHQRANEGFLRNLIVRNTSTDELMVIVVFGEDNANDIGNIMDFLQNSFSEITSLMYVVNLKVNDTISDQEIIVHFGKDHILEDMEGLKFKIGPKSFFQTNTHQALQLYRQTRELAELDPEDIVYDLYTGTGTIANYISQHCKFVIGIEYVPEAIEDAIENSKINHVDNTSFYAGDMKDILDDEFLLNNGNPDVIITDPPRAGMQDDVIKTLLRVEAKKIVYVSCNPATQARDLNLLSEKYRVTAIQPVDMFPHTHHVENIVRLDLRQGR